MDIDPNSFQRKQTLENSKLDLHLNPKLFKEKLTINFSINPLKMK
jgi:hypothetical protein